MVFLLPHTIDQSAERFPEQETFRFYEQSLTYAELVKRSNSLARTLIEQGVKRRDRVGIYMNKCIELPVAVYGTMKAGAAYVPLDASAPIARLNYLIQDCGIRHLITQTSKKNTLTQMVAAENDLECVVGIQPQEDLPIRCISWNEVFNATGETAPDVGTTEQDLAYIIYTSGSTGTPKGIMHTHHSGLSYAKLAVHTYGVHHLDRLGNHSPLHFDMSTFDFFAGPLAGATTVIIPEEYTKLPASLSKLIEDKKLTIWYSVPFALVQLLLRGALHARDLGSLRWVLFGGEPFPPKHLRALMTQLPNARFSNVYGPAEVNQCTYYHVPPRLDDSDEPISIGSVWDNTEGWVVSEDDQPVQDGEVGELLIRSPTMMQGYWGRPDLNQRAFYRRKVFMGYEDTFYRTGDLVQVQSDGNYKFLGRKDRQIKTRGYRVELDEIEVTLLSHDQVEETAVFPVADGEGSNRIEAAVILRNGAATTSADLANHLKTRLPWYAVPVKIELVDAFPRTSTGKIDHQKLQQRVERAGTEI